VYEDKVVWDVTPCSLINKYQGFGGACCSHFTAFLKIKLSLYAVTHLAMKTHGGVEVYLYSILISAVGGSE
jgi:hypothetical protein